MKIYIKTIAIFLLILLAASCIKEVDLYKGGSLREPAYLYPFDQENKNVTAEITIKTNSTINLELLDVYFAPLKYNKHLLIMLTKTIVSLVSIHEHGQVSMESLFRDNITIIMNN